MDSPVSEITTDNVTHSYLITVRLGNRSIDRRVTYAEVVTFGSSYIPSVVESLMETARGWQ